MASDDDGEKRAPKLFLSGAEFGRLGDRKLLDFVSSGLSRIADAGDAGSEGMAGEVGGSILVTFLKRVPERVDNGARISGSVFSFSDASSRATGAFGSQIEAAAAITW